MEPIPEENVYLHNTHQYQVVCRTIYNRNLKNLYECMPHQLAHNILLTINQENKELMFAEIASICQKYMLINENKRKFDKL